ncbi:glycosyltransferase family 39 protein [Pseudobutyrivibrio sp.]|uniref:glycosyltransferase family 39 protein n=1 Tax=Pseudobutyrivibrio sp. TaxID=2014367 RepID=UPI0025EE555F|nr:glycosyltransferase family 39 protein [Pseudobutyrivibrio sp.]MBR5648333.1 glycosyltransferase family 39 protein [Pseudobutyrivibrio sp.]
MLEAIDNKNNIFKFIIGIFALVWSFNVLNVGFYVDENGLLTIYKGFYQGQRLFVDSWEALQTGGILAYPLMALYYQVLSPLFASAGINIGLVLYMRIAYTICRLLVAVYLYLTIKRTAYDRGAYVASLFYYMFVMGWKNFSYKSYCDMAIMLLVCFLIRYYQEKKVRYFVYAAIATCVAILAYPTMILLAVFIFAFALLGIYRNEVSPKAIIAYVVTCLVIGGAFLVFLQFGSGIVNAIHQLKNFGDQDYDYGLLHRLGMLLVSYIGFAVIAYLPIIFLVIFKRFRYVSYIAEKVVFSAYWIIFFVIVCAVRIESISNSRFIYALLLLFFWLPYFIKQEEKSEYTVIGSYNSQISDEQGILWLMFSISIAAQFIWALSTNQDITVPGHMAIYAVIAFILIASNEDNDYIGLTCAIIIVDFFFMGFWVAEWNGGYSDVLETRYMVTNGELKGIILNTEDYDKNMSSYRLVTEYLSSEDKLLVAFGSNSTGYINSDALQGTYSVYARTQKNTMILDYWKEFPDNQADYVIIDESNDKYESFVDGEAGKYIIETYRNVVAKDGSLVLYSK